MRATIARRVSRWLLSGLIVSAALLSASASRAQKKGPPAKQVAPPAPPEALLKSDAWKDVPTTALQSGEIDQFLAKESSKLPQSPLTTDEQFLRRLRLDVTGQLPSTAELEQFVADKDPNKRARLIDKLLDSDDYARHWARYWREVVMAVDGVSPNLSAQFEAWLFDQFKSNRSWGEMVRGLITAEGSVKKDEDGTHGAVFFLARHTGPDGDNVRTAETARIFLGIQIQCAQCHNDRRTKIWKQVQFHELAGFFSRMATGGSSGSMMKITAKNNGEHEMPGKGINEKLLTPPRFLDGKAPPPNAADKQRRQALAEFLTAQDNYWFSAAFVNRMWTDLLGQGFYDRVDDLSPKSEVVFPAVAARLAASFSGSNYDIKALLRAILNSKAYQRQVRVGDTTTQHLHFASVYPTRLSDEVLWKALKNVLVQLPTDPHPSFKAEFAFDPSLKADEVTGSITQALWLMNNALVNERIKPGEVRMPRVPNSKEQPSNKPEASLLKVLLEKHASDDSAAIRTLYLQTLSRKPTDRELDTCVKFIAEVKDGKGTRTEAFEDLLKALINTTEFQRKR